MTNTTKEEGIIPESLQYQAVELLNEARMTKTPVIIVEGRDDVPIYQRLAKNLKKKCEVYASENICIPEAGCAGVIKNITIIRDMAKGLDISQFILGIIDRDARFYRGELIEDEALLILNHYSIENHFITKESIKYIIEQATRATEDLLSDNDCDILFEEIKSELDVLYFCSLEALRKACERDYTSEFGYAEKIRSILKSGAIERLNAKAESLAEFARGLGLEKNWTTILSICKGKWILQAFMDLVKAKLNKLPEYCRLNAISSCQFCVRKTYDLCLYNPTAKYESAHLEQMILHDLSQPSLNYIKARISLMI